MTRFLDGPVVAMFLAAACALTAYVLVTGAQTRPSAALTEREATVTAVQTSGPGSPARVVSRSVNVAYRRHSYPVDFRHRWILEKAHRLRTNTKLKAEHAYAQRLLRELRHVRTVQAHVEPRPPHYDAWLCIHRYEGAWDANTGNGFFGGLQMDMGFQRAYGAELLGAKGTADHWTPLEQMFVAERAFSGYNHIKARGYSPWPTTARMCGLT